MHKRFIDRANAKTIMKNNGGFFVRKHGSYILWICLSMIIILGTVKFIIDDTSSKLFNAEEALDGVDVILILITMTISAMILGAYLLINMMKLRYIIDITEFQASLFSSAMKTHAVLTCIVDKDKNVIYVDEHAFCIFKNKENEVEKLEDILSYQGLTESNKDKIELAVTQGTKEEVGMIYKDLAGESSDVILIVEPLKRPKGFSVIRCYDIKGKFM